MHLRDVAGGGLREHELGGGGHGGGALLQLAGPGAAAGQPLPAGLAVAQQRRAQPVQCLVAC